MYELINSFRQGGLVSSTADYFIIEVFSLFRVHQIIEESFLCLEHLAMYSLTSPSPEPFKFPTLLLCVLNLIWEPRDHLQNRECLAFEWGMFVQESPQSWIVLTHHGIEFPIAEGLKIALSRMSSARQLWSITLIFLKDIVQVGRGGLDIFRWMGMAISLDIIVCTDVIILVSNSEVYDMTIPVAKFWHMLDHSVLFQEFPGERLNYFWLKR